MDFWNSLTIGIMATLIGSGLIAIIKNKNNLRSTLSEWTRRGILIIYIPVPRDAQDTTLWLYLCGEEKSWLFPNIGDKNHNSCFLAMKSVCDAIPKWKQMDVQPLCDWIKEYPVYLVQLNGISKVLLAFSAIDNDETVIIPGSFKFKDELDECLKKYKIKYFRRSPNTIDRWKMESRYPT